MLICHNRFHPPSHSAGLPQQPFSADGPALVPPQEHPDDAVSVFTSPGDMDLGDKAGLYSRSLELEDMILQAGYCLLTQMFCGAVWSLGKVTQFPVLLGCCRACPAPKPDSFVGSGVGAAHTLHEGQVALQPCRRP